MIFIREHFLFDFEQILFANFFFCSIWSIFYSCFHAKKKNNNNKASFRTFEHSSRSKTFRSGHYERYFWISTIVDHSLVLRHFMTLGTTILSFPFHQLRNLVGYSPEKIEAATAIKSKDRYITGYCIPLFFLS